MNKKKILILGSSGFLGKNLLNKFKHNNSIFKLDRTDCDFTNLEKLKSKIKKIKPDIIFNCAGKVGGINYNILKPAEIFQNNIRILLNIFEISSEIRLKKLINIGSSCSYPSNIKQLEEKKLFTGPLNETVEAYGFWKLAGIMGAKAYYKEKKLKTINIIFPSIYGPGDNFDEKNSHVVGSLISKFYNAKKNNKTKIVLWGNGKSVREFLYIDDAIYYLEFLSKNYNNLEPINVGTGVGHSIKYLANLIKNKINYKGKIAWDNSKPNGTKSKVLNITKLSKLIRNKKLTPIQAGITKTIKWYGEKKKK